MGYLSGIEIQNDLSENITDVQVVSVVSNKSAGGGAFLAYAFNWSTVNTMTTSASAGNYKRREVIDDFGKLKYVQLKLENINVYPIQYPRLVSFDCVLDLNISMNLFSDFFDKCCSRSG